MALPLTQVFFLIGTLTALTIVDNVSARRRRELPYYLAMKNRDPNICAVQEVAGTGDRYFPKCLARRVLRLCGRSTFVRLQCCPGYEKVEGQPGCAASIPLENLIDTAESLQLKQFFHHARRPNFRKMLSPNQAYTIFAPNDEAFSESIRTSGDVRPSRLLYHIVPGRLNFSDFQRTQEYETLFRSNKIRVNKYPNGVATVNCARITQPNYEATNGMIHVIDQVVVPYAGESVITLLSNQPEKFGRFLAMIREAGLTRELTESSPLTIFAPTDDAIERLPPNVQRRLQKKRILKEFVKHHVVRKIICADAIVVSCGLTNMNDYRLRVSCQTDGHYVDGAKLIDHDMVGENGIVHAIENALLPDSVKDMVDLAADMKLEKFLDISEKAGLTTAMRNDEDYTIFAPTDEAFSSLSTEYMSALRTRPQLMKKLVNYHMVTGKVMSDQMVGQQDYASKSTIKIKVNVYRKGIMVDDARVMTSDRKSGNGVIHTIDKVLIPPEQTLMGLVQSDPTLSQFRQAIDIAGLKDLLDSEKQQLTVLAPTNDAFDAMTRTQLNSLMSNPGLLYKHLQHHMVKRFVVPCGLQPKTNYNMQSLEGETLRFSLDRAGKIKVFDTPMTVLNNNNNNNTMAVNGILYKVNNFLHCECKDRVIN